MKSIIRVFSEICDSFDSLESVERRVLEFRGDVQNVELICSRLFFRWWVYISLNRDIGVAKWTIFHPSDIIEMIRAV